MRKWMFLTLLLATAIGTHAHSTEEFYRNQQIRFLISVAQFFARLRKLRRNRMRILEETFAIDRRHDTSGGPVKQLGADAALQLPVPSKARIA